MLSEVGAFLEGVSSDSGNTEGCDIEHYMHIMVNLMSLRVLESAGVFYMIGPLNCFYGNSQRFIQAIRKNVFETA